VLITLTTTVTAIHHKPSTLAAHHLGALVLSGPSDRPTEGHAHARSGRRRGALDHVEQSRCNDHDVSSERPLGWLTEAVEAVLADLQQPRAIAVEVSYDRDQWRGETCWVVHVREPSERSGVSFIVEPEERGALLLERFADYLQEQFFPETRGAWGEARPACPGHTHPARPSWDEQADVAWWYCPATGRDIAPIGHYGEEQHRT
jgi:hypothetical protein